MKNNFYITLLISFITANLFAKDLSCSHYFHINAHDNDVTILKWQESIPFSLGNSDKELKEKIQQNKIKAQEILLLLKNHQKALAKLEIERIIKRPLTPADIIEELCKKFASSAVIEKELIKLKKDTYSEMTLKLLSEAQEIDGEIEINEGLLLSVNNLASNVKSNYYHALNGTSLFAPDASPRTLNEYKMDLTSYKIQDPSFGALKAISYKCIYPIVAPTTTEIEKEYERLIKDNQSKLATFRAKMKNQAQGIQSKEKEIFTPMNPSNSGGSGSSK